MVRACVHTHTHTHLCAHACMHPLEGKCTIPLDTLDSELIACDKVGAYPTTKRALQQQREIRLLYFKCFWANTNALRGHFQQC